MANIIDHGYHVQTKKQTNLNKSWFDGDLPKKYTKVSIQKSDPNSSDFPPLKCHSFCSDAFYFLHLIKKLIDSYMLYECFD